jgi:hypothetical protein
MEKWPRKQQQDCQSKEKRRMQRESTAHATEGANLAASAHNPGECTFNFCALREDGRACGLGASSRSSTRSRSPLSGQWSFEARGHWADFRCRPWHQVVRAVRCLPAVRHPHFSDLCMWGCGYNKGRWASRGASEGEGGGALGSNHIGRTLGSSNIGRALGRSSTSARHPPLPPLPRRFADIHRMSMRCGCIRDTTLREEASARQGSYWLLGSFGGQLLTDRRER